MVAEPGTSHHESGLAIDVPIETTRAFREQLRKGDWLWYCDATNRGRTRRCRDIPHHTFKGGEDLRSLNVLAFQQLWNHAHPDDLLEESGQYNMATSWRLNKTPLDGFPSGPSCESSAFITKVTQTPEERAVEQAIEAHILTSQSIVLAQRTASAPQKRVEVEEKPSFWSQLFEM